jgi:hypothetical protein
MIALTRRMEWMRTSLTDRELLVVDGLLIWSFTLFLQLVYLSWNYPAFWDEFYHLLAARSWLAEGNFRVAEGVYDRAPAITISTAVATSLFGESLFAARLFPALAGSLWVVAVFLWTRAVAGRMAGWLAALLFCFNPVTLEISGFVRFYALHGLVFWIGAIAAYAAVTVPASKPMLLWGAAAVAALMVALELQDVTYIGMVGLALWAALIFVSGGPAEKRHWRLVGAVALSAIVAVLLFLSGTLEHLLGRYSWTPGWAAELASGPTYYHLLFRGDYPTLYTLLPVAALMAIARVPKAATFALILFVTAFGLLSFAPAKSIRYLAFAMPFFYVLWGIAMAELLPALQRLASRATARYSETIGDVPFRPMVTVATMGVALTFVAVTNPAVLRTAAVLAGNSQGPLSGVLATDTSWRAAAATLNELSRSSDVVVTPNSLHALFYVGDYDLEYRRTGVIESMTGEEFGIDPRTGRPVISTADSLERLMVCFPSGLVFAELARWRHVTGIDSAAADLLTAAAAEVELPAEWRIKAFRWEQEPAALHLEDCSSLRELAGARPRASAISTPASQ